MPTMLATAFEPTHALIESFVMQPGMLRMLAEGAAVFALGLLTVIALRRRTAR